MNGGLHDSAVRSFALDGEPGQEALFAGSSGGVSRWSGTAWQPVSQGLECEAIWEILADPGHVHADLYAGTSNGVYELSDGTWHEIGPGLPPLSGVSSLSLQSDGGHRVLFAGTLGGGVFTWDGSDWAAINQGLVEGGLAVWDLALDSSTSPPKLYAMTHDGTFSWGGASWDPLDAQPFRMNYIGHLALDTSTSPAALYRGYGFWVERWNGASWDLLPSDSASWWEPISCLAVDPRTSPSMIYAGTYGSGIHQWNGSYWLPVNEGLTDLDILTLFVDSSKSPSTLYAGTGAGAFFREAPPVPPEISFVGAASSPYRLLVWGASFHPSAQVQVNGIPVPESVYKSATRVVAKGGASLKAMLPKGVPVRVTVTNLDDGGVSAAYTFTR
jgi:hypothetical protein